MRDLGWDHSSQVGAWDDAAGDFVPVLGEDAEGFESLGKLP